MTAVLSQPPLHLKRSRLNGTKLELVLTWLSLYDMCTRMEMEAQSLSHWLEIIKYALWQQAYLAPALWVVSFLPFWLIGSRAMSEQNLVVDYNLTVFQSCPDTQDSLCKSTLRNIQYCMHIKRHFYQQHHQAVIGVSNSANGFLDYFTYPGTRGRQQTMHTSNPSLGRKVYFLENGA
jgi:hypothetical protein